MDIYHSICAFANDFDNLGGGYVLVGVEENEYGIAKRPVTGINIEAVEWYSEAEGGDQQHVRPILSAANFCRGGGRATGVGDMGTIWS